MFSNSSYLARQFAQQIKNTHHLCPQKINVIVTILGARCPIGRYLALLLKQNPLVNEVRLYSECDIACKVSVDLNCIDTQPKVIGYSGHKLLKDAIQDAKIVVLCGGAQTEPCQTQKALFKKNMNYTRNVAVHMAEFCPKGIFLLARPPLNALLPLIIEEYKKAEAYDPRRVIGVTTLFGMRTNAFLADLTERDPTYLITPVIGGACPKTIIPVISQTQPPLNLEYSEFEKIVDKIVNAEDDVLQIMKKEGSGGFIKMSSALAISRFVNSVIRGLLGESRCVECAYVKQTGHICKFLEYMASIVVLGTDGIESCHMPKINGSEVVQLKKAKQYILQAIARGTNTDLSQQIKAKKRPKCKVVVEEEKEPAETNLCFTK